MTLEEVIQKVEDAGFYWAIERDESGTYSACVDRKSNYLGDDLSGPCAVGGDTPQEALLKALNQELEDEAKRTSQITEMATDETSI